MKPLLHIFTLLPAFASAVLATDGLPVLQRCTMDNKELWQWETKLTGHLERNGAVSECLAQSLAELLQKAGMEPTVESLVQVLTSPSDYDTPQSSIKELILPRTSRILVSQDATLAIIATPIRGRLNLEIFRDTTDGLTAQRIRE